MSLRIGQIRYNSDTTYLSTDDIFAEGTSLREVTKSSFKIFGDDICDTYLKFSDDSYFKSEFTYYLTVQIAKQDFEQNIKFKLVNDDYVSYFASDAEKVGDYQLLSERIFHVDALPVEEIQPEEQTEDIPNITDDSEEEKDYEYVSFNLVFTPNADIYNNLIIELDRTELSNANAIAIINMEQTDEYKILQRIVPLAIGEENSSIISKIKEIGIQGNPGLLFAINGEPFHLGKTGTFVLDDDDFTYTSIGFCCDNDIDTFILDYKYES